MKLVLATPIRTAYRWSKGAVSDLELRLLRQELGIDPPPTDYKGQETDRRNSRRMSSHHSVYSGICT
jgi:hypothetical protein